ncbi:hypothetical protein [Stackebrandtia nassauensis]|nr:hypothetical protein [Stackebrandtia nassauensis]
MSLSQTDAAARSARHPRDPEPVPSTKAAAAYALSVLALATAPFLGGVIPAIITLRLSAQADADIAASEGFLLGAARNRRARKNAFLAFGITGLAILTLFTWWVFRETVQSVS